MDLAVDQSERLDAIRRERIETMKNIQLLSTEYEHVKHFLEEQGVSSESELEARRNQGRKKFNNKMGLDYLFDNHIIDRTPYAVAKFFMDEKNSLSKLAIGTYLGEISKDFNMQVLDEYLKIHAFGGQDFLSALRKFLLSFKLPGESQKIDKILNSFAQQYVAQNPEVFRSSHEAYVMAYAAILLNTTLHNSNAKGQNHSLGDEKKFVRTMLEYGQDTNLSEEMIRSVYHGIKSDQIQVAEDETIELGIMRGWLWKLGGRVKSWKRRWFVLTEDRLLYYTAPERTQKKGIIALDNVSIRRVTDRSRDNCFELFSRQDQFINTKKADREGVVITGYHTTYRMAASCDDEYNSWVSSLQIITDRYGNNRRGASVPCFSNRLPYTIPADITSNLSAAANHSNQLTNGNGRAV